MGWAAVRNNGSFFEEVPAGGYQKSSKKVVLSLEKKLLPLVVHSAGVTEGGKRLLSCPMLVFFPSEETAIWIGAQCILMATGTHPLLISKGLWIALTFCLTLGMVLPLCLAQNLSPADQGPYFVKQRDRIPYPCFSWFSFQLFHYKPQLWQNQACSCRLESLWKISRD